MSKYVGNASLVRLAVGFVTVSTESRFRSESGRAAVDVTEVGDLSFRSVDTSMCLALVSQKVMPISESLVTVLVLTGVGHGVA